MKKNLTILVMLTIMSTSCCIKLTAQITLDTIIPQMYGYWFYTMQISTNETKWIFPDTANNKFSMYNMDFTPFMLNIPVPEPFNPAHFQVIYVSRTLFDNDESTIEYAYEVQINGLHKRPFYIMRTDGTQLFKLDTAIGMYDFGALDGSQDIRPILNTSDGAKLILYHPLLNGKFYIYSLPGELENDVYSFPKTNENYVKIYPNPASNILTFEVIIPSNIENYELVIMNFESKEVKREIIYKNNQRIDLDVSFMSAGQYLYSLCSKQKSFKTGKFIISK